MFSKFENDELIHAIAQAEKGSIGELRVVILPRIKGDVLEAAKRHFVLQHLEKTQGRSGVLLLVSMKDHKIAILGDVGIHEKVGDHFWQSVIRRAIEHFKAGEPVRALLSAIDEIGLAFRVHLPGEKGEGNELPDQPHYG